MFMLHENFLEYNLQLQTWKVGQLNSTLHINDTNQKILYLPLASLDSTQMFSSSIKRLTSAKLPS